MKKLILKIKEYKPGSFFVGGHVIYSVVASVDGVIEDLGDYFIRPDNYYSVMEKLKSLKKKYESEGYELYGDWN